MEFSKNKNVIVLLSITIILVLLGSSYLSIGGTGGMVVSLSNIDFSANGQNFNKEYRANVVLNGGGDYLQGTSPLTQAKSADGSVVSQEKFKVTFNMNDQYCQYSSNPSTTITKLTAVEYEYNNDNFGATCKLATLNNPIEKEFAGYIGTTPIYCYFAKDFSDVGTSCSKNLVENCPMGYKPIYCGKMAWNIVNTQLKNGYACIKVTTESTPTFNIFTPTPPLTRFSSTVTVSKESGASEQITVSSEQTRGSTPNVKATYIGDLRSLNPACPSEASFYFMQGTGINSNFQATIDRNKIEDVRTKFAAAQSDYNSIVGKHSDGATPSTLASFISEANDYNAQVDGVASFGTVDGSTSTQIKKETTFSLTSYPMLLLSINADWLGIVSPVSNPKITSLQSSINTKAGQSVDVPITVTNTGSSGGVSVDVSCPGMTPSWKNSITSFYDAGAVKTGTFALSTTTKGTYICIVTASSSSTGASTGTNKDVKSLTANVAEACTKVCDQAYYIDYGACECKCLQDTSYCIDRGLILNTALGCGCQQPVIPPKLCGGTIANGACKFETGERCNEVAGIMTLSKDKTCVQCGTNQYVSDNYTCVDSCIAPNTIIGGKCVGPDYTLYYIIGAIVAIPGGYYFFIRKRSKR